MKLVNIAIARTKNKDKFIIFGKTEKGETVSMAISRDLLEFLNEKIGEKLQDG